LTFYVFQSVPLHDKIHFIHLFYGEFKMQSSNRSLNTRRMIGIHGIETLVRLRMLLVGAGSVSKLKNGQIAILIPPSDTLLLLGRFKSGREMAELRSLKSTINPMDIRDPIAFSAMMQAIDHEFWSLGGVARGVPIRHLLHVADIAFSDNSSKMLHLRKGAIGNFSSQMDFGVWEGVWQPSSIACYLKQQVESSPLFPVYRHSFGSGDFTHESYVRWNRQASNMVLGLARGRNSVVPKHWRRIRTLAGMRAASMRIGYITDPLVPWLNVPAGSYTENVMQLGEIGCWMLEDTRTGSPLLIAFRSFNHLRISLPIGLPSRLKKDYDKDIAILSDILDVLVD
jgi:hypothetical protein